MNIGIGSMMEVLRWAGVDFSSWDVKTLLPGGAWLWGIAALYVGFCLLCVWHDARLTRQDHEGGTDRL